MPSEMDVKGEGEERGDRVFIPSERGKRIKIGRITISLISGVL